MKTPRRRQDLLSTMVDEDLLLLDRNRGLIHRLNHTAGFIWNRCDGAAEIADVATEMANAFDIDSVSAERDVTAVVERLTSVGVFEQQGSRVGATLERKNREEQS